MLAFLLNFLVPVGLALGLINVLENYICRHYDSLLENVPYLSSHGHHRHKGCVVRVAMLRVTQAAEYFDQLKQSETGWHLCISALATQPYSAYVPYI